MTMCEFMYVDFMKLKEGISNVWQLSNFVNSVESLLLFDKRHAYLCPIEMCSLLKVLKTIQITKFQYHSIDFNGFQCVSILFRTFQYHTVFIRVSEIFNTDPLPPWFAHILYFMFFERHLKHSHNVLFSVLFVFFF